MIYDITPEIRSELHVWPGDTAPSREILLDMARGDNLTLSTLRTTVHVGAHADAPSHYGETGDSIERRDPGLYVGLCEILRPGVERGTRMGPDLLDRPVRAPRVLFATGTYDPDGTRFDEGFAALSPELIDVLHDQGVRLIGIDTPSVDLFSSKDLPSHKRCLAHDMAILEGLALDGVPPGVYDLVALPLKLAGFDASPVRAVLRTLSDR